MPYIEMKAEGNAYTLVSNIFIDEYMPLANPAYVSVYLYGLRRSKSGTVLTTDEMATVLGLLESDLLRAWKYWDEQGVIKFIEEDEGFKIDYINAIKPKKNNDNGTVSDNANTFEAQKLVIDARPRYTVQEIEVYNNTSSEIHAYFKFVEGLLGRLLKYDDLVILFGLYDWLRLPIEVIKLLIGNCVQNDHRNLRYIEKAAINWAENNINTEEKARNYIESYSLYYKILAAFGRKGHNPTKYELVYLKRWVKEFALPMELITEACEKTVLAIGEPKFSYANKILADWKEKGFTTIEQIKESDEEFVQAKLQDKNTMQKNEPEISLFKRETVNAKKTRFSNFKQHERDFSEIERKERELLERSYAGL